MRGVVFQRGPYPKKYTAIIMATGKRVHFGDRRYQHFRDRTPLRLYSHLDHNDLARRDNYRKRHGSIRLKKDGSLAYMNKYSPAWFSYYYLW
jgi:hypothetical protein